MGKIHRQLVNLQIVSIFVCLNVRPIVANVSKLRGDCYLIHFEIEEGLTGLCRKLEWFSFYEIGRAADPQKGFARYRWRGTAGNIVGCTSNFHYVQKENTSSTLKEIKRCDIYPHHTNIDLRNGVLFILTKSDTLTGNFL